MEKENHQLLRYDEPPRSGFVQLLSLLPPNRRYIPILKLPTNRENCPQYPLIMLILSSLSFPAKAASLAVYLDISPQDIQISFTRGISRYQPAACDDSPFVHCLQPIGRTLHSPPTTIEYMGIHHRRVDILVAEQFLYSADVVTVFQ